MGWWDKPWIVITTKRDSPRAWFSCTFEQQHLTLPSHISLFRAAASVIVNNVRHHVRHQRVRSLIAILYFFCVVSYHETRRIIQAECKWVDQRPGTSSCSRVSNHFNKRLMALYKRYVTRLRRPCKSCMKERVYSFDTDHPPSDLFLLISRRDTCLLNAHLEICIRFSDT